jgi:hypothetical protein
MRHGSEVTGYRLLARRFIELIVKGVIFVTIKGCAVVFARIRDAKVGVAGVPGKTDADV